MSQRWSSQAIAWWPEPVATIMVIAYAVSPPWLATAPKCRGSGGGRGRGPEGEGEGATGAGEAVVGGRQNPNVLSVSSLSLPTPLS